MKGHPTILLEMGKRNNVPLPAFEDYLRPGRFDEICKTLIDFYSGDPDNLLTRKDIKWLFNKTTQEFITSIILNYTSYATHYTSYAVHCVALY